MEKNKAGRPAFRENERRRANLKVRLLDSEIEKLRKLYGYSKEVSQSEMIRSILFGKPINVKIDNTKIQSLIYQVNAIRQTLTALIKSGNIGELNNEIVEVRGLYETLNKELSVLKAQKISLTDLMESTEDERHYY